jgi:sugar transferase EpsL
VLFRQQRAGRDGATYELVKFRTMRTAEPGDDGLDTDEAGLTKFRRLLRATSLDELSTLVNVLPGKMRLVGPRPLPIRYLPRYLAHPRPPPQGVAGHHRVRPRPTGATP